MKQKIIMAALPNGINGNKLKISVAISLQVEDANTTLQSVPDMLNWASLIKNAGFTVQINGASVQATVKDAVDPPTWKNLFAPTVKVKSFVQQDLSAIKLLSYPVKHIVDYLNEVTAQIGNSYSNDLPDANFYTNNQKLTEISEYGVLQIDPANNPKRSLKEMVIDKGLKNRVKEALNKSRVIPFSTSKNPPLDFAQLKNFHGSYDKKMVQTHKPIVKPDFEFHEILTILGSHPQLGRKLGLIIDLEIPNTPSVGTSPTVRVVPSNINFATPATTITCPATAFIKTTTGFYAKANSGSLIDRGHLRLNTSAFTVFQLDTDGGALKLCDMMDALILKKANHHYQALENMLPFTDIPALHNEAPKKEGTPSHRTMGIGVAKNGMANLLVQKYERMKTLKASLLVPGPSPGALNTNANVILTNEILYADDVNLGYRMDIKPDGGKWRSVHERVNSYSYINSSGTNVKIDGLADDEGFIQISSSEEDTPTGKQWKVGEVLARWEGWSLSVPRPGSALNDPIIDKKEVYDKNKPAERLKEEAKYRTPLTADFKLNVLPVVKKDSLPKLRFGTSYSIKIRTVDLAGNSVAIDSAPESPEATFPNVRYLRYEPAGAPFLVLGTDIKDGESSEVLVIRSNEGVSTADYESANKDTKHITAYDPEAVRFVKPPRCTVEMAITHSMLDKGFGLGNEALAAKYYQMITKDKDPIVNTSANTPKLEVEKPGATQGMINVEYLVDPMAAGVTLFISANDPNPKAPNPDNYTKRVSFYFDDEVNTDALANKTADTEVWFQPKTFRIVLKEGAFKVDWDGASRVLSVYLPKASILKMNYASFWRPNDLLNNSGILKTLGVTNITTDTFGKRIAMGQHWMFSPWREITFMHATQQPLPVVEGKTYPLIEVIKPERNYGENFASLHSVLHAHGRSTDKVDLEASWNEWVDDVTHEELEVQPAKGKVSHFTTKYNINEYAFGDMVKGAPPPIKHQFNDTKHRMVDYHTIATTRYREQFFQLIKDKPGAFDLTRKSAVVKKINILSSARPAAPQVEYVIPIFEWQRRTKDNFNQAMRFPGLRVYMKRPWYSSGEGELLAVVLFEANIFNIAATATPLPATHWGTDPTKLSAPMPSNLYPNQSHFRKPVTQEDSLTVAENENRKVPIVAYGVKFDKERQLYYTDIMIDTERAYFPFIRLALARYQKDSLRQLERDCCLSQIFQTDYIQVPAMRVNTVTFGATRNIVTVALTGNIPTISSGPLPPFRTKLEFIIESIEAPATESAHISINSRPIELHNHFPDQGDIKNNAFSHSYQFNLPEKYHTEAYRIKILEYEMIPYDEQKPSTEISIQSTVLIRPMKERLVYADVFEVNKNILR